MGGLEFEIVRDGRNGRADYAVSNGFVLTFVLEVGGEVDTERVASVVHVIAGDHPVAFELLGFLSGICNTEVEAMVIWVPYIVSCIGSRIGYNVSLHGILTGVEGGGCTCTEDEVGRKLPFIIEFVLRNHVQIVEAIESVGVPISIVDTNHLSFRAGECIAYPTC